MLHLNSSRERAPALHAEEAWNLPVSGEVVLLKNAWEQNVQSE